MQRAFFQTALSILIIVLFAASTEANELLVNGGFSKWEAGVPQGWRVEIGEQNGQGPESSIERIEDSGLSLQGTQQPGSGSRSARASSSNRAAVTV